MSRFDHEIINEEYESLFNHFSKRINPVLDRVDGYFSEPVKRPHNFSHELLEEIEILHMRLSTALYRLRHAEIREQLETGEINSKDFIEEIKAIDLSNMYKTI